MRFSYRCFFLCDQFIFSVGEAIVCSNVFNQVWSCCLYCVYELELQVFLINIVLSFAEKKNVPSLFLASSMQCVYVRVHRKSHELGWGCLSIFCRSTQNTWTWLFINWCMHFQLLLRREMHVSFIIMSSVYIVSFKANFEMRPF